MGLSIDDFARLDQEAGEWVADTFGKSLEQFRQPEIERADIAEYDNLTPEQHAGILQQRGESDYQSWADEMERLKVKHGG